MFTILRYPEISGVVVVLPLPFGYSAERYVKSFDYEAPILTCVLATIVPKCSEIFKNENFHTLRLIPDERFFKPAGRTVSFRVPMEPEQLTRIGETTMLLCALARLHFCIRTSELCLAMIFSLICADCQRPQSFNGLQMRLHRAELQIPFIEQERNKIMYCFV